jgi:hypothetical protein
LSLGCGAVVGHLGSSSCRLPTATRRGCARRRRLLHYIVVVIVLIVERRIESREHILRKDGLDFFFRRLKRRLGRGLCTDSVLRLRQQALELAAATERCRAASGERRGRLRQALE